MRSDEVSRALCTPEQIAGYSKSETEKWTKVIKAAGIKPQ